MFEKNTPAVFLQRKLTLGKKQEGEIRRESTHWSLWATLLSRRPERQKQSGKRKTVPAKEAKEIPL